jgi:transcriptional regulator with XRE-family HTH domain
MPARRRAAPDDVGLELRRWREAAGLTAAEVAAALSWAESTLTRKETGSIRIKPAELDRLLDLYQIDESARVRMRDLVRVRSTATRRSSSRTGGALADVVERYVELEEIAAEISLYAAMVVPTLLQIPEYANAIIAATPVPEDDLIRPRMDFRMSRQGAALVRVPPTALRVILDEAVLLRPIGGAQVMRAQALRLIEMSERSHISLRILPMAVGAHPGLTGQFSVLRFGDGARPAVVFCDGLTGGALSEQNDDVQRYRACFNALNELANNEDDSLALIHATADRFMREESRET